MGSLVSVVVAFLTMGQADPWLENCCFILDLKLGSVIIGIITLICGIIGTLVLGFFLPYLAFAFDSPRGPNTELQVFIVSYLCLLAISILYVVFSAILICGYKDSVSSSLPWIFLTVVSLILQIVLTSIFGGLTGEIDPIETLGIVLAVVTQTKNVARKGAGQQKTTRAKMWRRW